MADRLGHAYDVRLALIGLLTTVLFATQTATQIPSGRLIDRLGARTAMAHHVGALYNVPHGEANAILLPHSMRFNLDASAERQALIASATLHDRALATNPKPISDAGPIIGVLRNAW